MVNVVKDAQALDTVTTAVLTSCGRLEYDDNLGGITERKVETEDIFRSI